MVYIHIYRKGNGLEKERERDIYVAIPFSREKKGLPLAAEICLCTDVEFWEVGTGYKGVS